MPTRRERIRVASNRLNLLPLNQLIAVLVIMLPVLLAGGSDQCQFAPYRDDAQSAHQKAILSRGDAPEIKHTDAGAQTSAEISFKSPNLKRKGDAPLILQARLF
jgi:hypothetical protein